MPRRRGGVRCRRRRGPGRDRPSRGGCAAPGAAPLAGRHADLREYLPIETGGEVRGVVVMWRDAGPVLARLADVRRDVVLVTLSAALIAAALLFLIFRAAQRRLTRQTVELIESTRRDPLTGRSTTARSSPTSRTRSSAPARPGCRSASRWSTSTTSDCSTTPRARRGRPGLLAVRRPARARGLRRAMVVGRYGPDEFLLVAPAAAVWSLEPASYTAQDALADLSLQFEATERLPVTISAGLATYPEHGASVDAAARRGRARTLEEAKASGGDAVRVAGLEVADQATSATFDVLQGLVHAVDTKDRYTKRHSEDVARYGVFLAAASGSTPS